MKKILVVDDKQDILQTLEMILTLEGYSVSLAYDGQEGLKWLKDSKPDLIISDIMMPIMNGIEMVKTIRANPSMKSIPIIMLSAVQPEARLTENKSWNVFIKKPPDLDKLLYTINQLLTN